MDYTDTPADTLPNDLRRIVIVGTTGSGKTTLAKHLARGFKVPHVEFDAFRHGPNWTETPDEEFKELLSEALSGDSWIGDGNYTVARQVVWPRATMLVWLDYPFGIIFWRLVWRTLRRGIFRQRLWNGNRENLWTQFATKESLFLWAFKIHWQRRRTLPPALALPEYSHIRVLRMRSPKTTNKWLQEIITAEFALHNDSSR